MERARLVQQLVIAAFGVLVLLPPLQMLFRPFNLTALEERRTLKELEDVFPRAVRLDPSLGADLNAWFDDHAAFRDLLIRAKNEIDFTLFGVSRKVYIGRDGWLFHRHYADSQVRLQRMPDAKMERIQ